MRNTILISITVLLIGAAGYLLFFSKPERQNQTKNVQREMAAAVANRNAESTPAETYKEDDHDTSFKNTTKHSIKATFNGEIPVTNQNTKDISTMSIESLRDLANNPDAVPRLTKSEFGQMVNRLYEAANQGQSVALEALVGLARNYPDDESLHMVLQALGRSNLPEADAVLIETLQDYLDDPISVYRITSYLPRDRGNIRQDTVEALFALSQTPGILPEVKKYLSTTIFRQGGSYGRQLIDQNDIIRRPH